MQNFIGFSDLLHLPRIMKATQANSITGVA
jgi:hypothetical protein